MSRSLRSFCFSLVLACSLLAVPGFGADYQALELTQVDPLHGFENSVRYQVSYWAEVAGQKVEVFPTRAEKERDFDLILAQVVRLYITDEYDAKGRFLDETDVKPASPQEILHLVSHDSVSPAWSSSHQEALSRYLQLNANSLVLNKIAAYLDYNDGKGNWFSGIDVDPVLFRFGQGAGRDEVSLIQVQTEMD